MKLVHRCFLRTSSSLDRYKGGGCGHGSPRSGGSTALAFAIMCQSSAGFFMREFKMFATGQVKQAEFTASLVDASTYDFDCVQRSMPRPMTLSNALFLALFASMVSVYREEAFLFLLYLGSSSDKKVRECVLHASLFRLLGAFCALSS